MVALEEARRRSWPEERAEIRDESDISIGRDEPNQGHRLPRNICDSHGYMHRQTVSACTCVCGSEQSWHNRFLDDVSFPGSPQVVMWLLHRKSTCCF